MYISILFVYCCLYTYVCIRNIKKYYNDMIMIASLKNSLSSMTTIYHYYSMITIV